MLAAGCGVNQLHRVGAPKYLRRMAAARQHQQLLGTMDAMEMGHRHLDYWAPYTAQTPASLKDEEAHGGGAVRLGRQAWIWRWS